MIYILYNLGQKKIPLGTKGRTSILSYREYVRPAELHSLSAEENCPTEKVASLRSVKVATPPVSYEQLRAEKERAETQLAQEQHKLERLENRKKYLEKGERTKRTHRLCNLGGTIESLAPEVKDLTRTEMTELMEHIFSLSEVQRAVRHMAITHISQANREKELKADGTISSERHAD